MKCKEFCETMPDLAAGMATVTPETEDHLKHCAPCAAKLNEFRQTMALLDQWQAPEPSVYFDVRLQARLREESARNVSLWQRWLRRPAMALALTVLVAAGITLFQGDYSHRPEQMANVNTFPQSVMQPGTAVGDLSQLDKNHDLYSDFDLLDDLQVQDDVTANP
jgi:predicted anti-sigma-YlaC factor YlaD